MGTFDHDGVTRRTSTPDLLLDTKPLGFGTYFTEHMTTMEWNATDGWHNGRVRGYEPLALYPSAVVFHYGQAIFEGLKAYRQPHGDVALFRPYENAHRFDRSAARISMPPLPDDVFVEAIEALIDVDRAWVPEGVNRSLYLRPFMIATEPTLAVRPAATYLFAVIASPVDGFFSVTVDPIKVWLSTDYVRSAPGGTGDAKFSGNYAGSLIAQKQAAEHECAQVVWLDATERRYVEEMGAMNIFFVEVIDGVQRLVTPALTGTQLPGVTRDSIMILARSLGYEIVERPVSVQEWRQGSEDGTYTEAFACGTAAVITPIGGVRSSTDNWTIGGGQTGELTGMLRQRLIDIQYGVETDTFDWMHKVG